MACLRHSINRVCRQTTRNMIKFISSGRKHCNNRKEKWRGGHAWHDLCFCVSRKLCFYYTKTIRGDAHCVVQCRCRKQACKDAHCVVQCRCRKHCRPFAEQMDGAITCVAGYRKATLHIGKKTNNMQTYRKKAYHV